MRRNDLPMRRHSTCWVREPQETQIRMVDGAQWPIDEHIAICAAPSNRRAGAPDLRHGRMCLLRYQREDPAANRSTAYARW
jgi:hypothetical protein